ncbi:MAG TPA: hypothetical protein VJT75_16930 [Thermoleophilaceae bacterium]|nr:hypothetical protein [Thermoleophilaceae bacterium]
MKSRSGLVWLGALALILVVPPIAGSVVGSGDSTQTVDQRQNARLDRHSQRLKQHGAQLRRLRRVDVGVARGYILTDGERMEAIKGATVVTSPLSRTAGAPTMGGLTFQVVAGPHDEGVRVRGAIRSSIAGGGKGAAIGALFVVCAPMGEGTCAGGSVSAGETVCALNASYNAGLTVPVPKGTPLDDTASPKATDADIANGTCALPGPGRYSGFLSYKFGEDKE